MSITLIKLHSAFDRNNKDIIPLDCMGENLYALKERHFPTNLPVAVSINGGLVPKEDWSSTVIRNGDVVLMVPELQGGDVGKTIFRIVAFVAIAVVAWEVAPYLGTLAGEFGLNMGLSMGAWFMYSAVTLLSGIGILMAGGALISAISPNTKPPPSLGGGGMTPSLTSNTYSWQPQTTQIQGYVIPRFYGENKVYGNMIDFFRNNDGAKNYVNVLVCLGMGPYSSITEFKVNDQLLDANLVDTFGQPIVRLGHVDQAPIPYFKATKIETAWVVPVTHEGGPQYYTMEGVVDGLEVDIAFPSGIFALDAQTGNMVTLSCSFEIKIQKVGGTGAWYNLTETAEGNTYTPTESYWGIFYWAFWDGYWILLENVYLINLRDHNPNAHAEGEEYGTHTTFQPTQFWHWVNAGQTITVGSNTGGSWIAIGSSSKPLFFTARAEYLPEGSGEYKVSVTKLSPDYTDSFHKTDLSTVAVRSLVYDPFEYPRHALVGVKGLATEKISGNFNFSCKVKGALVQVYKPDTDVWEVEYSNNPAWVCWDIITQPVIHLTNVLRWDGLHPSHLIPYLDAWLEWADFCDAQVPDGRGGWEKRITFNGGFDTEYTVWDAAMKVADMGRATLIWIGVNLSVYVDKPLQEGEPPSQLFTMGNINQSTFKLTYLPMAERASEIEATYINSEKDFSQDTFSDFNTSIKTKASKVNVQLFGLNKPSEVCRYIRHKLARNQCIIRKAEFEVDVDVLGSTVGNVIAVQHDIPKYGLAGGRILYGTAWSVFLDQDVTIEEGVDYSIQLKSNNNDVIQVRNVDMTPGVYRTITVSTIFDPFPQEDDVYGFGPVGKTNKLFRIISMAPNNELKFLLGLEEYDENMYTTDYGIPAIPPPDVSNLEVYPEVTDIHVAEFMSKRTDGTIDVWVELSFRIPSYNFTTTEIWTNIGSGWEYTRSDAVGKSSFPAISGKTYDIAIRTRNGLNQLMPLDKAPRISITVLGETAPPPRPENFLIVTQPDGTRQFTWEYPDSPVDFLGFILYYAMGLGKTLEDTWSDGSPVMVPLHVGYLLASPYETNQLDAGAYTFALCASDRTKHLSEPAYIEGELDDPRLGDSAFSFYVHSGGWPGTKTDCHVESKTGWLVADDETTWETLPATWSQWTTWISDAKSPITYEHTEIDLGKAIQCEPVIQVTGNGDIVKEINYSTDGNTWSGWVAPSKIICQYLKVRIVASTNSLVTVPILKTMVIHIKAKIIKEMFNDLQTSSLTGDYRLGTGDIRIPITKPYGFILHISVTLQNTGAGWSWEQIDKAVPPDEVGPRIKIYNDSKVAADCTVDISVEGV